MSYLIIEVRYAFQKIMLMFKYLFIGPVENGKVYHNMIQEGWMNIRYTLAVGAVIMKKM